MEFENDRIKSDCAAEFSDPAYDNFCEQTAKAYDNCVRDMNNDADYCKIITENAADARYETDMATKAAIDIFIAGTSQKPTAAEKTCVDMLGGNAGSDDGFARICQKRNDAAERCAQSASAAKAALCSITAESVWNMSEGVLNGINEQIKGVGSSGSVLAKNLQNRQSGTSRTAIWIICTAAVAAIAAVSAIAVKAVKTAVKRKNAPAQGKNDSIFQNGSAHGMRAEAAQAEPNNDRQIIETAELFGQQGRNSKSLHRIGQTKPDSAEQLKTGKGMSIA